MHKMLLVVLTKLSTATHPASTMTPCVDKAVLTNDGVVLRTSSNRLHLKSRGDRNRFLTVTVGIQELLAPCKQIVGVTHSKGMKRTDRHLVELLASKKFSRFLLDVGPSSEVCLGVW